MIRTRGPKGRVVLKVHAHLTGQRTHLRTQDQTVSRTIAKLDEDGIWHWLRDAALWQGAESLSEDEQLAMVLTEIGDPDHPQHGGVAYILKSLGAEGALAARDALTRQKRLTEATWKYWGQRVGEKPEAEGEERPEFYEPFQWAEVTEETMDARCYVEPDEGLEIWVGKPG